MAGNRRYEVPTWDQVYDMLVDLAGQVKESGFRPEVIVGVSRGGWPPARVMSDLLENQNLANMKVVFYKGIGARNKRPIITQPATSAVKGRRVLVVDDVSDTGHSLRVVSTHLLRKGATELKVCTLYLKPKSIFVPDFYSRKTGKWVIFPWERFEAVTLLTKKAGPEASVLRFVGRELKGSGMSVRLIKRLLRLANDT